MNDDEQLEHQAIHETIGIEPYDVEWPSRFIVERDRLCDLATELIAIEHIGSTAIPGLAAKPIIDIMATVASIDIADNIVERLCANGYITSAEFNRTLRDRRWLMRHADGRRTHHLYLLVAGDFHWTECIQFRDVLRQDRRVAEQYEALKRRLAGTLGDDREAYGAAKSAFIAAAVRDAGQPAIEQNLDRLETVLGGEG